MAKLLVTCPDKSPAHVFIEDERVTIGRNETCGVRLDSVGVSKEHAAITPVGNDHILEDLGSTNGTLVNGEKITRHILQNRDVFEIGTCRLQYINQRAMKNMDYDRTMLFEGETGGEANFDSTMVDTSRARENPGPAGLLRGKTGPMAGKPIPLNRVIHKLEADNGSVAVILRRPQGYMVLHVSGGAMPQVNGRAIKDAWQPLQPNDEIEFRGQVYVFDVLAA